MAKLKGLIRLKRHELDEKRRVLAELSEQLETVQHNRKQILDRLETEKNLATVDFKAAQNFGQYLNNALNQCRDCDKKIEHLRHEIEQAREVVRIAFMEVKKVELTQENRDKAEKAVIAKRETAQMDEAGLNSHRRRSD